MLVFWRVLLGQLNIGPFDEALPAGTRWQGHRHLVWEYFFASFPSPKITSLTTNMSPEKQWLEDVFRTEIVPF